jgi:hypothetical protein
MKKNLLISFLAVLMIFGWQNVFAQGTTTSGMNGRVFDNAGETLPGATVVVLDLPTGTQFGTVTDASGYYRIPNMNVGGPYKVTVSFVGFQPYVKDDIFLTLGQTLKLDVKLSESAITLADVEVVASLPVDWRFCALNTSGKRKWWYRRHYSCRYQQPLQCYLV